MQIADFLENEDDHNKLEEVHQYLFHIRMEHTFIEINKVSVLLHMSTQLVKLIL